LGWLLRLLPPAGKTLFPYQGLKLQDLQDYACEWGSRKNPISLSGIETNAPSNQRGGSTQSRKNPISLSGIETRLEPKRQMVEKRRKNPISLSGIETITVLNFVISVAQTAGKTLFPYQGLKREIIANYSTK